MYLSTQVSRGRDLSSHSNSNKGLEWYRRHQEWLSIKMYILASKHLLSTSMFLRAPSVTTTWPTNACHKNHSSLRCQRWPLLAALLIFRQHPYPRYSQRWWQDELRTDIRTKATPISERKRAQYHVTIALVVIRANHLTSNIIIDSSNSINRLQSPQVLTSCRKSRRPLIWWTICSANLIHSEQLQELHPGRKPIITTLTRLHLQHKELLPNGRSVMAASSQIWSEKDQLGGLHDSFNI